MTSDFKLCFKNSLAGRILIPGLLILIGIIVLMLGITSWFYFKESIQKINLNLFSTADIYENEIQNWLVAREGGAYFIAGCPTIQEGLNQVIEGGPEAGYYKDLCLKHLKELGFFIPMYEEVYFTDRFGNIYLSTNPERIGERRPSDDIVKKPLENGKVFFSDAYLAFSTKNPCVAYSVPVKGRGKTASLYPDGYIGVLVFRISVKQILESIFVGHKNLGKSGEIILLRQDSLYVNDLHFRPDAGLKLHAFTEPEMRSLRKEEGVMQAVDYAGHKVLAAYRHVPYSNWGLVVKQDMDEIISSILRSATLISLPVVIGLIFIVFLIISLVRQSTLQLRDFVFSTREFARGNFTHRMKINARNDELSILSRVFNEVAQVLQEQFKARDRLDQVLQVLVSTIHMAPLLEVALSTIAKEHGFQVGAIYLYDTKKMILRKAAAYCPSDKLLLKEEILPRLGPVGETLRTQKPLLLEEIPADTIYTVQTISGEMLPAHIFHLPIIFGNNVLGVIVLGSLYKSESGVLPQLETACIMLGAVVNNVRIFEQANELSEKLSRLNEKLAMQNEELQVQAEELKVQAEELQVQERELREKNLQLEQATRSKSEFLARMSHELRTPLNAVIGFSEVLLEGIFGELNEKQREYIGDILASGRYLLNLINDILDLAKIEAGKIDFAPGVVDPAIPLKESLSLIMPDMRCKKLSLEIGIKHGEYIVEADPERLKQIFNNLLSNAVKFTPEDGQIKIYAVPYEKELRIFVSDTGVGIPKEMHEVIFEEFKQVKDAFRRQFRGTGLGLSITRQLVEMHGGQIWVCESEPGQGSTFVFTLFLVNQAANGVVEAAAASREDMLRRFQKCLSSCPDKGTILLAEDDPYSIKLIIDYLREQNYNIITVTNGADVLARAKEIRPWVIILDVLLPGKDGWEVLAELKSVPETKDIPVIIISALDEKGKGFSLGALDYFVKPVDKELLLARIESLRLSQRPALPAVLVVDDEPEVVEYLTVILEAGGYKVSQAYGGKEAIELALKEKPEVLILDLMMPEVTGFDVVEELSGHSETAKVAIFILTARDLSQEEKKKLSAKVMAIARKGQLTREQFLEQLERIRSMTHYRSGKA